MRLRAGHSLEDRERATARLFAALERYCADALRTTSLAPSMEMREIDPGPSPKAGSIREHLPAAPR